MPPPIINGGGHKKQNKKTLVNKDKLSTNYTRINPTNRQQLKLRLGNQEITRISYIFKFNELT